VDRRHDACLTGDRLLRAYREILALLERWEIGATFAFVMAFALSEEELRSRPELLETGDRRKEAWLAPFRAEAAAGRIDGWLLPEALEAVRATGRHEVACHGFTHLPLQDDRAPRSVVREELERALLVARAKGVTLETLVFPDNAVGHVDLLARCGFRGYRDRLARPGGALRRPLALVEEFRVRTPAQAHAARQGRGALAIPSGYFLNWRAGLRRAVPSSVTLARWRHILLDAVRQGKVAHLWLHPHNVIDGRGTLQLLDGILEMVAGHRARGELEVLSQAAYLDTVHPAPDGREVGPAR
jgi:peptidoglycan/xylan/chitin deacetylase (PgdA/CDA1 family)